MENEHKKPDYKGDGVAVWVETVKTGENKGKLCLSIQILGKHGIRLYAFKNEPKKENKPKTKLDVLLA